MNKRSAVAIAFVLAISTMAYAQDGTPPAVTDAAVVQTDATPASQPVVLLPPAVPVTVEEAIVAGQEVIEAGKVRNWWGMSAGIIWLLMFLMKTFGLFVKIGKRWAYVIVPALSIGAMVLSKLAGDLSWLGAIGVLTSGPTVALLNDLIKRGILGKEPTTPVKVKSALPQT